MRAQGDVGLVGLMDVDNQVGVVIQDSVFLEFQDFVQSYTNPAHSHGGDVGVKICGMAVGLLTVMRFHPLLLETTHILNVVLVRIHEQKKRDGGL